MDINPNLKDPIMAAQYWFDFGLVVIFSIVILLLMPVENEGCAKSLLKVFLAFIVLCCEIYYAVVIMGGKYL